MATKKLYRSETNKIIAGVCGGVSEHLGIDPTVVRILWVLLSLSMGIGVGLYIILLLVVPSESHKNANNKVNDIPKPIIKKSEVQISKTKTVTPVKTKIKTSAKTKPSPRKTSIKKTKKPSK